MCKLSHSRATAIDIWLDHKVGSFKAQSVFIFPLLSATVEQALQPKTHTQVAPLELLFMGMLGGGKDKHEAMDQ